MPGPVVQAFLAELAHREPDARPALRALRPAEDGDPRAQALGLVTFALQDWLGQALEYAAAPHADLVARTGRHLSDFEVIADEDAAREAGRFALAVADLARQARADDIHAIALHVGLAGLATADGDWALAGRRAAIAAFHTAGALEVPIEAEAALRAIRAL